MTRFGEKLKEGRSRLGLGQEQLAELCGVTRRTIVSYETGGKLPRPRTLQRLSEVLIVTQRYLTTDSCDDPRAGIEEEPHLNAAMEAYGRRGADEMAALLRQNQALFAGGSLSEEQKDLFYEAVTKAYFLNKQRAREKFGARSDT